MTGPSLLAAAVDELYAAPLAEFTGRRKALAAAAKKAGDRDAATAIGGLRKPTLSADTVNRLVRGAPDEVGELLQLGADLRQAEAAFDAAEMRRLGDRRRHLVNDLADLAFELTGQSKPSAAVRDEVTATLNAALADEEVAHRLSSGALVTQARWDGFGSTQLPELAASMPDLPRPRAVPAKRVERAAGSPDAEAEAATRTVRDRKAAAPEPVDRSDAPASGAPARRTSRETSAERAEAAKRAAEADRSRRVQQRADAEKARQQREDAQRAAEQQAVAQQAAEAAEQAAARAADAQELVSTIDRRVSELNLQLAHQRRLLADAQRALRAAESERRATALAATRAGAPTR